MSAFRLTQLQMEDFFILPGVSTYLLVSMVALLTFSKEKTHGAHTLTSTPVKLLGYNLACYSAS